MSISSAPICCKVHGVQLLVPQHFPRNFLQNARDVVFGTFKLAKWWIWKSAAKAIADPSSKFLQTNIS